MATITARKTKKGTRYTAQVRVMRDGACVYQKAKTFETKTAAKAWSNKAELNWEAEIVAKARERQKPTPKPLGLSIAEACGKYYQDLSLGPKQAGRTKAATLLQLSKMDYLKEIDFETATADQLYGFAKACFEGIRLWDGTTYKTSPQRIDDFMQYIKSTYKHAQIEWSNRIELREIELAMSATYERGYRARSKRRERRPTVEEVSALMEHVNRERSGKGSASRYEIPYLILIPFLLFSARRLDEMCRIRWDDLDEEGQRVLVRKMKHPRRKEDNDKWVGLPPRAMALIKKMPRVDQRIFPYSSKSVGNGITRIKQAAGWDDDMCAHSLRHEGTSYYAELDLSLRDLMFITGHSSQEIDRYMHFTRRTSEDKWAGWDWLSHLSIDALPSIWPSPKAR